METPARTDAGTPLDPQRLRYITENFSTLQGLTWVALGAVFLLPPMERMDDIYGKNWPIGGWLLLVVFTAFVAAMRYIPRYYRRRFGWVEPREPSNKQVVIFLLVFFVCLFGGRGLGQRLDRYADDLSQVIHSMISDPTGQVKLLPVVLWIAAIPVNLLKRSQRLIDPYRIHFLCFGTVTFSVIAFYPIRHPEAAQSLIWRTLNAGSLGFSMMAWGLYNHITLVRMMPKKFAGNDDDE